MTPTRDCMCDHCAVKFAEYDENGKPYLLYLPGPKKCRAIKLSFCAQHDRNKLPATGTQKPICTECEKTRGHSRDDRRTRI